MSQTVELTNDMRSRITDKVAGILYFSHSESEKRQTQLSKDRLNFACPYCGDSSSNHRKKRGNIYWNDLYYHCYNCGVHETLDAFLEHFNHNFEGEDRINVLNYIRENLHRVSLQENLNFHLFDEIEALALTFDQVALGFNVYPINESTHRAYPYLKSRLLHKNLRSFGYDPRRKELYVFNYTPSGKIIGFQTRALDDTNGGPKYKTWNMERIYDRLKTPHGLSADIIESINKMSMLFGIMQVDMSQDFTIFEGPIDAKFMRNSVGITGVKKKVSEFDEIPTARYMFDNDIEGKRKMIEKATAGHRVFMWKKFLEDYHIPSKKVKDLNDLVMYEYNNKTGCLPSINSYFTTSSLDIIYL